MLRGNDVWWVEWEWWVEWGEESYRGSGGDGGVVRWSGEEGRGGVV